MFYNPQLTLNFLNEKNLAEQIFARWFALLDEKVKRLHDLKLFILALSTLFYLPFATWPAVLQRELKVIFNTIFATIRKYEARKLNKEQESDETTSDEEDDDEDDDEDGVEVNNDDKDVGSSSEDTSDEEEGMNDEEIKALAIMKATAKYEEQDNIDPNAAAQSLFKRLDEEYSDVSDSDEFDLEDDEDFETLIDDIDEILFFLEAFQAFSQRDEQVYVQLMNSLTDEEKMNFQQLTTEASVRQNASRTPKIQKK
jgi:hypothetical protein